MGVIKAFSTCVGEGPFVAEWFGEQAEELRKIGGEYGAATGRPRRVGPIDIPATRYGVRMQGATEAAITEVDNLSYMKEIPICQWYDIDGKLYDMFPFTPLLERAKPVMTTMPGWGDDITQGSAGIRSCPTGARNYIEYIENAIECPIKYVSVGPERDDIILRYMLYIVWRYKRLLEAPKTFLGAFFVRGRCNSQGINSSLKKSRKGVDKGKSEVVI